MKKEFTTAEIAAAAANDGRGPEFVGFAELQARFGIRRSHAYVLLKEKKIRGVSLRRRGRTRGRRLFDVASVREFLNKCREDANGR